MIAIVDYGIGGLGLYRIIRKDFPKFPILYFSDSGEVPYGKLSRKPLRARLEKVFHYLRSQGANKIIVACHSASSVVLDSDKDVIGLRSQTVKAVLKQRGKNIGIIGGGRTVRSGYYRRDLTKAGLTAKQRVAQPLSILVERGEIDSKNVHKAVASIIKPLKSCDAILLACTHYPVLSKVITKQFDVKLIDPIEELYKSIHKLLNEKESGESMFITTGNRSLMIKAARKAFDVEIKKVKKVLLK